MKTPKKPTKKEQREQAYLRELESLPVKYRDLYAAARSQFRGVNQFREWAEAPSNESDSTVGEFLIQRYGNVLPSIPELNRRLRDARSEMTKARQHGRAQAKILTQSCKSAVAEQQAKLHELKQLEGQEYASAEKQCAVDFEALPQRTAKRVCSTRKQRVRLGTDARSSAIRADIADTRGSCAKNRATLRSTVTRHLSDFFGQKADLEADKRLLARKKNPHTPF